MMYGCKIFPHCPPHCGCAPGVTDKDTITLVDEGAKLLAAHPRSDLDFDTRLMLAGIAIDVALSAHGTEEAHAAVTEALSTVAAPATHIAEVTPGPEWNPHPTLQAAADIIRARGWVQNNWTDDKGAVCIMQAIQTASVSDETYMAGAEVTLMNRIRATGESLASIPAWNDVPGRTVDQVLRILG